MRKFSLPSFLADAWRPSVFAVVTLVLLVGLFTFRLGKLTPGLSESEATFVASSSSVSGIIENPLHLYQKVGNLALKKVNKDTNASVRLLNAALGITAVLAMYAILKQWYTTRVSLLATTLFGTSSWLLYTARYADTSMSYVLPLGLVIGGMWMHEGKYLRLASLIAAASTILLMYTPAMVWLVLPAAVWQRKFIRNTFTGLSTLWQALVVVSCIIGVAPLVWSFINDPALIKVWLGIPSDLPEPLVYLRNVAEVPVNLFIRGTGDPTQGIGKLPLLDIFTSVMFLLGIFVNAYKLRLDRTKLLLGAAIIGTLFIALEGPLSISFLLPFIYLAAAGGIALLLQQWFTVFPRNPLARSIGVVIVTGAVGMASFYHLTKYFVAWPHVPATRESFQQQIR